ncbi:NUDIX domain-containing protein [Abditibacterium utsteinense]|uniref:NUDIX domain-containing protein n=1 Tax=Abditibacterium utsteinense TaxID=1960156 RepID=A0A2S8SU32_9BACT|nr:NUDIX domain-containing protein [Abditibacterium utsteinense]PQV64312.1 NUDIX domain-containing protein [Abditibacterium utsteinense]
MKDRELIARAVIWKDSALLVNGNHNKKTGEKYVALPGGHVDPGEHCVEALKREIEEELAASCEVGNLLFVTESIYAGREIGEKQRHELTLFFAATISGEQTRDDGTIFSPEKWKNFHWLTKNQVESANLLPADAKSWLAGKSADLYSFSDTKN